MTQFGRKTNESWIILFVSKFSDSFETPKIFTCQGFGNVSVLDVNVNQHIGKGALRNFLSFRIEEPRMEKE
jgi:hypothetical protein